MRPSKYIELTQNRKDVHRAEDKQRRSGSENGREAAVARGERGAAFQGPQADNETCQLKLKLLSGSVASVAVSCRWHKIICKQTDKQLANQMLLTPCLSLSLSLSLYQSFCLSFHIAPGPGSAQRAATMALHGVRTGRGRRRPGRLCGHSS